MNYYIEYIKSLNVEELRDRFFRLEKENEELKLEIKKLEKQNETNRS